MQIKGMGAQRARHNFVCIWQDASARLDEWTRKQKHVRHAARDALARSQLERNYYKAHAYVSSKQRQEVVRLLWIWKLFLLLRERIFNLHLGQMRIYIFFALIIGSCWNGPAEALSWPHSHRRAIYLFVSGEKDAKESVLREITLETRAGERILLSVRPSVIRLYLPRGSFARAAINHRCALHLVCIIPRLSPAAHLGEKNWRRARIAGFLFTPLLYDSTDSDGLIFCYSFVGLRRNWMK